MHSISDNYQIGPSSRQDISNISTHAETEVLIPAIVNGQGVADHVDISQQNPNPNPAAVTLSPPVFDPDLPRPTFYEVIATLKQHMQTSTLASLDATLALNQRLADARVAELNQAIEAVNVAKSNLENASKDLAEKNQLLDAAQNSLAEKANQLEFAQTKLEKDQAYLQIAQADSEKYPDDALRKDKYEAAEATVNQSRQDLSRAQAENATAAEAVTQAAAAAIGAAQLAADAQSEVNRCTENLVNATNSTPDVIAAATQQYKTGLDILMECMAKLTMLLNKSNQEKLDRDLAIYKTQQKNLQDKLVDQAKKFEDSLARSERAQKWTKIAGKIAGVLLIAMSGVAAVASGGALSILVVAVTAGVMAADTGLEASGNKTLTSMAMDPVMKGLTKAIADDIKRRHPGCSDEKAQTWAAVCTMVIVCAATVLVAKGSSAVNTAGLNSSRPEVKAFFESASKFWLGSAQNAGAAATAGMEANRATAAMGVISTGLHAGGGIAVGMAEKDKSEADAETTIQKALLAIVKALIDDSVEQFCSSNEAFELNKHLSEWITQNQSTLAGITGNIRA